ncbi:MAG: Chromosomal replication initiator protein DnaA [Planctomycetota bacterium]
MRVELHRALGGHRYQLWFEHGTTIARRGHGFEIETSNAYAMDWIERSFRGTIDECTARVLGEGAACRVSVRADEPEEDGVDSAEGSARRAVATGDARATERTTPRAGGQAGTQAGMRNGAHPTPRTPRGATLRRLEDFIVGESNRLAFAASEQFGEGADEAPRILFLHGECGVGKTHLLQGLCRRRNERAPRSVVRYVTAEQFTNEYIAAVRDGSLEAFRRRLRRVDLLAIDDVHFFANKTATQAEFLHTIDAIDLSGARIALVSDEHPRHIRRFSQSLVSRFLSGMVVKVERPDRPTRSSLVARLARERGLDLTTAAEDLVAGRFAGSVREIEGAVTRLAALAELDGLRGQLGPGTIERLLGDDAPALPGGAPIRLGAIVEAVCGALGVAKDDLLGQGRHKRTVLARGVVAHLARELTAHSYPEIARALGRDTHSAVHTAAKRLREEIERDAVIALDSESIRVRETVDRLRHDLRRGPRTNSR